MCSQFRLDAEASKIEVKIKELETKRTKSTTNDDKTSEKTALATVEVFLAFIIPKCDWSSFNILNQTTIV
jgi:hypothetical protein